MEPDLHEEATSRVQKKKEYYTHLAVYLAVGIFFLILNILTFDQSGRIWFFFPLLPWSIGLFVHYLYVFGFPGSGILTDEWEQEEVRREVKRLHHQRGVQLPKLDAGEDRLDLTPRSTQKMHQWREDDFV